MLARKGVHKSAWYLFGGLLLAIFAFALTSASTTATQAMPSPRVSSCSSSAPMATNTPACGLAWRGVSIPLPQGTSRLDGVASISPSDVWAVGSYTNNGITQTLTMHWDGALWSIIPSYNGFGANSWLSAVVAYASDDVWAVGAEGTSTTSHTLIEHWDGAVWSWVPSPNVSTLGENVLRGVAIAGPNDMWAVGYNSFSFVHRNLTEHWNGSDWSVIPSPNDGTNDNLLHAVTATGPNDVWAVGTHLQTNINFYRTTNIHWNGSTWTLYTDPPSYGDNYFFGAFALAPNNVWAVGGEEDMIAHWDGSSWHNTGPVVLGDLHGVSGTAQNDVWAVGNITETGYYPIYHYDGSFWWNIPSNSGSYLQAVTALSRNDAWAVGYDDNNEALIEHYSDPCATPTPTPTGTPPTATLTRTPTSTSTPTATACTNYVVTQDFGVPIVPGTQNIGINCDDCVTSITLPFTYRLYDQTFTSATVSSNGNLQFLSSSSAFINTCLPAPDFNYAIMPYWDDLLIDSPSYGVFTSTMGSAPNRTFNIEWRTNCFSECNLDFEVVLYENQTRFDVIYGSMTRNGESATIGVQQGISGNFTQYSCNAFNTTRPGMRLIFTLQPCTTTTPTPTPIATATQCPPSWEYVPGRNWGTQSIFYGVAVPSTTYGWAVGTYTDTLRGTQGALTESWVTDQWAIADDRPLNATIYDTEAISTNDGWSVGSNGATSLIRHWVGSGWVTVAHNDPGTYSNSLKGIAVLAANDIWAAGYYSDSAQGARRTLIEHWDGSTWSTIPSPNIGILDNYLSHIDGTSQANLWAVGNYYDGSRYATLTMRYLGGQWSVVPSPNAGADLNVLTSVAVNSSTDAWAVGYYNDAAGVQRTLTMHWDGPNWTIVPSPNASGGDNALYSTVAIGTNEVWAVGTASTTTLAMIWDGSTWSVAHSTTFSGLNMIYDVTIVPGGGLWAVGAYGPANGERVLTLRYPGQPICGPSTPTPSATSTATSTRTVTVTSTRTPTITATGTNTPISMATGTPTATVVATYTIPSTITATATACPIQFTDVPQGSTFYSYIRCLACMGIVGGYADGTFRPNNNVTRGQLSKTISNAAGFIEPETMQRYEDVPVGSTFQVYIGRLASRGYISGYPCGGLGEPCVPPGNLPYFRPSGNATRGQISKIVSEAAGFQEPPVGQSFEDVLPGSTFYPYIQRLASRTIMSGYPCGGPSEPCVPPDDRPYFRPGRNVTRGQTTKIVANTFFPACQSANHP